jgi:protein-L-isoaspartate(D-aspartate) O-methyltransferase
MPGDFAVQRAAMVEALHLRLAAMSEPLGRGAIDRALGAMAIVARERFVCPLIDDLAYCPGPIAIGSDQIMSHPALVAVLAAAADPRGGDVLDVGTGSGYQAAVLSRMAHSVTSIEIIAPLAGLAAWRLARDGYRNVQVCTGDAATSEFAPHSFDAIVVAAGADCVPQTLLQALRPGGRLIMPIGPTTETENLVLISRQQGEPMRQIVLQPAQFVPLTGAGCRALESAAACDDWPPAEKMQTTCTIRSEVPDQIVTGQFRKRNKAHWRSRPCVQRSRYKRCGQRRTAGRNRNCC